jgi:predicted porin
MCGTRVLRSLVALLAAVVVFFSHQGGAAAQAGSAQTDQSMQDRIRQMQQQIDELNRQLQQMKADQAKTQQQVQATQQQATQTAQQFTATQKKVDAADKSMQTFMKGFFGTLDVSIDDTTKGMNGFVAYPYTCSTPQGGLPCFIPPGTAPKMGPYGTITPYGRVGWMPAMSSNGSNVGYRGTHQIDDSHVDFIYQISTAIDMVAAPGLQDTWTKQSNTVQGAIGLGDTYLGFQAKEWGKLKFGTVFMPYKTSTDRLNPFAGQLGNYSTIMGNTGGDNRIEFGTRGDHVMLYNSPTWNGLSFDGAYQFGQNPDTYNNIVSLGGTDCYGGNIPGSGNLPLNCDDGGYNWGASFDLKYETGGLYLTAAYEKHNGVNRSSDGVGSNNPYYGYIYGLGPNSTVQCAKGITCASLLNWSDFLAFEGEYPNAAPAGSPEFNPAVDTADEWAYKFGGQYAFEFGLTVSYMYESLHRDVPYYMQWQNERQRNGDWVALEYDLNGGRDRIAAGWAHAGASVGDPGGQHNYNPNGIGDNQANMYTIAWWHKLDKQLTWYLDAADTANDGNAHFDMGAGGHGIKTDCHDATHPLFIDYSSAGPTTWGGCHILGVSTGINFKF